MSLFDKIFKKNIGERETYAYFKTLTAYKPTFTTYEGGLYEMALTRAAIHQFATLCSKLKPEVSGSRNERLQRMLQYKPNPWMDTASFLYRLATITEVNNNAFIAPLLGDDMETITGYFPLLPSRCELIEYGGEMWIRYTFANGQRGAIELSKSGIITKMQYEDDLFGSDNRPIKPTMQLLDTQRQGIDEGIKAGAAIRFLARLAQTFNDKTIAAERKRFREEDLSTENNGGVMIFDAKYADIKQVESRPFTVDAEQQKRIEESVFFYFGTNEKILTNAFDEDTYNAYYEAKVEPWALRAGLALTNMTFSMTEIAFKNQIMLSSNRLQYASNTTKLNTVTQLMDRGVLNRNEAREVFQLPPVDEGDVYYIRGEYVDANTRAVAIKEENPDEE